MTGQRAARLRQSTPLRLALAAGAGLAALAAAAPASADEAACGDLLSSGAIADVVSMDAVMVAADAATGAPAFCEVTATISPAEGSAIGVVYRLPEDWNGKVLGLGGGGFMGNVALPTAIPGLKRGYATMQTDAGHAPGPAFDTAWAADADGRANMVAIEDFSHRAVHVMTVAGKAVADAYYGRAAERSYWQGCSTGGRQGLMEVQRYPEDYDGVIAGAPVYDLRVQTSGFIRAMNFQGERRLAAGHPATINAAVLAACDAADGAADGVVRDPRRCSWDPGEIECPDGEASDACLSPAQIDAVRVAYDGVQLSNGAIAAFPLSRGSEGTWGGYAGDAPVNANEGALVGLNDAMFRDPAFEMSSFDPERHVPMVREGAFGQMYEAGDPAISDYLGRGGKLLLWHGFYDTGPSPLATLDYYEEVLVQNAGADQSVRLFLAPGVGHCRGGPGPDQFDLLTTLESWVEQSRAPDEMAATKADSDLAWPVCAYPKLPRGQQNADGSTSYVCE
jgi:feruloyl esterase